MARGKNKDLAKTTAIGVTNLSHKGGLLGRHADSSGILIGQNVMVSSECVGVLLAGEQVTATLAEGMHLLGIEHFNRQPAAIVYTVSTEPVTVSWYPKDTPYRRSMTVQVKDASRFVERMVIRHDFEQSDEIVDFLAERIDREIPVGTWATATEPARTSILSLLAQHGLALDAFEEAKDAAKPPPPPK